MSENKVVPIPIATADRLKSGYAFVNDPARMASVTISLIYEKKIEAPATVMLTDTELLIVGTQGLVALGLDEYESRLRQIVEQNKVWATIQAVYAILKEGDKPVMHLRAEVKRDPSGLRDYGAVIFGWAKKQDGSVAVMAHPEAGYPLGTPYLLRPKLVLAD